MRSNSTTDHDQRGQDDSAGPSNKRVVQVFCDHARLAQRLADAISELRQARRGHEDTRAARDHVRAVLVEDLVPSLQAEEGALRSVSATQRRGGSRAKRRLRQQLHEYRQLTDAVHAMQRAEDDWEFLGHAEAVMARLFAHLAGEDRELVGAVAAGAEEYSAGVAVLAELDALLVHDHARISAAITTARDATSAGSDEALGAYDRAVADLSHHAAVMATRAYPVIAQARLGQGRAATQALTEDLQGTERALVHLHRSLRGAAGEDMSLDNRNRLWHDVEQSWQHHVTNEQKLIHGLNPLLGPELAVSVIIMLRGPFNHALTRPHPQLLHSGWPTRLAIHAQYRCDRWRDATDGRAG